MSFSQLERLQIHVCPDLFLKGLPAESGLEVQQRPMMSQPGAKIYGKRNYQDKTAYVIGFNNGGWKFYAQEQSGNNITKAFQVLA
jgi:hypothetical protein